MWRLYRVRIMIAPATILFWSIRSGLLYNRTGKIIDIQHSSHTSIRDTQQWALYLDIVNLTARDSEAIVP
ncbi:hypothetical protein CDV31_006100 [Fusarium ambrosium]|uniref:Uncharacterized protein n=1 Tax=Fusarium ambrosium TaxID=131363 RepID=A0A428UFC9_9HYPO|nr:hypothetical protein CDV31_006100 [Fusarium ambrosium]